MLFSSKNRRPVVAQPVLLVRRGLIESICVVKPCASRLSRPGTETARRSGVVLSNPALDTNTRRVHGNRLHCEVACGRTGVEPLADSNPRTPLQNPWARFKLLAVARMVHSFSISFRQSADKIRTPRGKKFPLVSELAAEVSCRWDGQLPARVIPAENRVKPPGRAQGLGREAGQNVRNRLAGRGPKNGRLAAGAA